MPLTPDPGIDRQISIEEIRSLHAGMNDRDNPDSIGEFQARYIVDAETHRPGAVRRRAGTTSLYAPTSVSEPYGLTLWNPPSALTSPKLVGYWDDDSSGLQLWQSSGAGAWEAFDSGISLAANLHQFTMGRALYTPDVGTSSGQTSYVTALFMSSANRGDSGGSFPMSGLAWRLDITTATDRASQTFDVRPRSALWWQGRLWAANSSSTEHGIDWLGWSDIWDGRAGWTDVNQNIRVDPNSGQEITGLYPVRSSTNQMYIFKERSIFRLSVYWDTDGYYTESQDTLDTTESRLEQVAAGVGCVATKCIVEVQLRDGKSDILFLAHDGIRSILRAEQDTAAGAGPPMSEEIQETIDTINWDYAYKAVATTYKNYALFAVPTSGATTNNRVLVYDTLHGGWSVLTWAITDWVYGALSGLERKLYFQSQAAFTETNGSNPYSAYHVYNGFAGDDDPGGSAIQFSVRSRAFTSGAPVALKRWDFVEVGAGSLDTTATLTVYYRQDERNWLQLGYLSFDEATNEWPTLPFELPWNGTSERVVYKSMDLSSIPPSYTLEIRLDDLKSFGQYRLRRISVGGRPYPRTYHGS